MEPDFDPQTHRYTMPSGRPLGRSVSSVVSRHWPAFDGPRIARQCGPAAREKWTGDPCGSDAQVLEAWAKNSKEAAAAGTAMHERIELFFRGSASHRLDDPTRVWLENRFGQDWVFEPEKRICGPVVPGGRIIPGTVDLLATDPNGDHWLFDWKRGSIDDDNGDVDPVSGLRGTKFVKYSLQLAFYAAILDANYGISVPAHRRRLVQVREDIEPHEVDVKDVDALVAVVSSLE